MPYLAPAPLVVCVASFLPGAPGATPASAQHPQAIEIARTPDGRPVLVHRYGPAATAGTPAVLVVAGADGRFRSAVEIARALGARFAEAAREDAADTASRRIPEGTAVYILADLNPDHTAWRTAPGTPGVDWGRAPGVDDADRDGRTGEDGGADLNGDGFITQMRVRDPDPRYGLDTGWVIDPDDARRMRRADPARGETGTHALLIESTDQDGDGRFAEDGIAGAAGGGIDLDLNFPALWPEFTDGAGPAPLSRPETRGLAEWLLTRPEIVALVVLGRHDSIVNVPVPGRFDATGRVPLGIEEGDRALYERVSRRFRDLTGRTSSEAPDDAGSLARWSYAHLGLPTFAVRTAPQPTAAADGRTEAPGPGPATGDPPAPAADSGPPRTGGPPARRGRGGAAPAGAARTAPAAEGDDAAWLRMSDERGGAGFIPWRAFQHPRLGAVEIGGFTPGFRYALSADEQASLTDHLEQTIIDLLRDLPRLVFDVRAVTREASGLWRIHVRLENAGRMATATAMLEKTRRLPPLVASIGVPPDRIVAGTPLIRWNTLAPGESVTGTWLIRAEDGASIDITLRSVVSGDQTRTIRLEESRP